MYYKYLCYVYVIYIVYTYSHSHWLSLWTIECCIYLYIVFLALVIIIILLLSLFCILLFRLLFIARNNLYLYGWFMKRNFTGESCYCCFDFSACIICYLHWNRAINWRLSIAKHVFCICFSAINWLSFWQSN